MIIKNAAVMIITGIMSFLATAADSAVVIQKHAEAAQLHEHVVKHHKKSAELHRHGNHEEAKKEANLANEKAKEALKKTSESLEGSIQDLDE